MRVGMYPISASSAIMIVSAQSAMSDPPATAYPCTLQITGRYDRHRLMNNSVFLIMKA
jgi:hypothetical protein